MNRSEASDLLSRTARASPSSQGDCVCFGLRVALLKKSGEEDWKNRINRKQEVVKVSSEHQDTPPTGVDKVRTSSTCRTLSFSLA